MPEQRVEKPLGFPFDGKYLKLLTPVTIDGMVPKVDEETGIAEYKETHHPLSARKFLEERNAELPRHLRSKIVEVDSAVQRMDPEAQAVANGKIPPKKIKQAQADELLK